MKLNIIYQDEHLIVVDKPSGLLCVPGLSDPQNLHDHILVDFPNSRVVHRLDMSTSGLVMFAQNHPTQKAIGEMFLQKKIQKSYIAEVAGCIEAQCGEVISPLICDWENRPKQKVDWLAGKRSHTRYSVIKATDKCTRVALSPVTGRTHQLRLHMLQLGHPILGDRLYNPSVSDDSRERLRLHARRLQLLHPITHTELDICCEPNF